MKARIIALLVLALGIPGALDAQSPEARIEAARDRVAQVGIEPGLLDLRVAEGRAKGVPLGVIADVIERRADALVTAGEALRPITPTLRQADLAAGADAVEAGIPAGAIQQVAREARAEDRSVAISVLTYLSSEASLPLEVAIRNVSDAIRRGPDALRELPAQASPAAGVRGNSEGGRPPAAGSAGPGERPTTGPPSGVPGPVERPGRPDPPGQGPSGQGPPGRN